MLCMLTSRPCPLSKPVSPDISYNGKGTLLFYNRQSRFTSHYRLHVYDIALYVVFVDRAILVFGEDH